MSQVIFFDVPLPEDIQRRRTIDIIVSIPVRYALTRHVDVNGLRREFSGRVVKISLHEMVLAAPVKGAVGDRVIATMLGFGRIEGAILKNHNLGFVMNINMTDDERDKFAAKIEWYEKHKQHEVADNRCSKRIIPDNPHSVVILGDGSVTGAFVIDVSVTGAAVSADVDVNIGDPVAVGKIVGRVVRYLPGGFAVKFIESQDPRLLENALRVPSSSSS